MDRVEIKRLWNFSTPYRFNVLCVGTLFRQNGLKVVIGGEDGIVRIYDLTSLQSGEFESSEITLETKSGPIQTMVMYDMTKFDNKDLIVADTCGMLTLFCNQQILCRKSIFDVSINCLQVQADATGNTSIVVSDDQGVIAAIMPSEDLWKTNLNNIKVRKQLSENVKVKCLLAVDLLSEHGQLCSYILASDSAKHLYFLHQGVVVMVIDTPSVITAMCCGRFISATKLDGSLHANGSISQDVTQVALGSTSGAIYILHNFSITEDEFANAHNPVTKLTTLPSLESEIDCLLCTGHFNSLYVYRDTKMVGQFTTPDWINTLDMANMETDGIKQVVVGCLDNSIHAFKVVTT